jgi:WD40 repeat protein/beta-lactamase regulating signal transducer with metallopeptidase domain
MSQLDVTFVARLLEPALALRLTLTLLHFLWQGALLGVVALAADRALRRASSRSRYALFVGILLAMGAALPATFLLVRVDGEQSPTPPLSVAHASAPIVLTSAPSAPKLPPAGAGLPLTATGGDVATLPISALERVDPPTAPQPTAELPPRSRIESYAAVIAIAYLAGSLLMLARLAVALHGGRRLRLAATPIPDGPITELVRRQAQQIGLKAVPLVAWCSRISVPVVVGILRPMILLPAALATGFDPSQLEALLTHELAHIRRFDPLVNLLQRLIEVVLFFHPAVWYVSCRVSAERENACDDLVVAAGWPAVSYAQALLQMAELCTAARGIPPQSSAALAATGCGSSQFKRRVLRLLEIDDAPRLRLSRAAVASIVIAAILMFALPAIIPAVAQKTRPSAETKVDPDGHARSTLASGAGQELDSDPLPAGAVLRLGTVRLRHPRAVTSVAFSPNGQAVASVAWLDSQIRIWDVHTGRLIRALVGSNRDTPRSVLFSPDGKTLSVTCERGAVQLWDLASGLLLWQSSYRTGGQRANSVAFAPDGKTLATSAGDGAVRLLDARQGKKLLVLQPTRRRGDPLPVAFSPDGKLLACGAERQIRLYDHKRGVAVGTIENAHGDDVISLAFSPDGKTLFSAGSDFQFIRGDVGQSNAQLRMWDVASRKLIRDFFATKVEPGPCAAALSNDSRTLISAQPNKLLIWDVASGKVLRQFPDYWLPPIARDRTIDLRFSFDTNVVAISSDGVTIAAAGHPLHHVTFWDATTGAERLVFPESHCAQVQAAACSTDGTLFVTGGGQDGTVRLWDAGSGKQLRALVMGDHFPAMVRSVALSRDGKTLAAGGHDCKDGQDSGLVRLWDARTGAIRRDVRVGKDVAKIAVSGDGRKLAIAASDFSEFFMRKDRENSGDDPDQRFLLIVDADTGAEQQRVTVSSQVTGLEFSPDGAAVSVAAVSKSVVFGSWDVASRRLRYTSVGAGVPPDRVRGSQKPSRQICSAAMSQDGASAVVSCFDGEVAAIWDLTSGRQVGQVDLENEGNMAGPVAISPDRRVIASSSFRRDDMTGDDSLRLWDAKTGHLLKQYSLPRGNRIGALEFTPDGRRLISGMSDGTALVWDASAR